MFYLFVFLSYIVTQTESIFKLYSDSDFNGMKERPRTELLLINLAVTRNILNAMGSSHESNLPRSIRNLFTILLRHIAKNCRFNHILNRSIHIRNDPTFRRSVEFSAEPLFANEINHYCCTQLKYLCTCIDNFSSHFSAC